MSVLVEPEAPTPSGPAEGTLRGQWLQGVSMGASVQAAGMGLAFGAGVLAARLLGPAGLGEYAYALAAAGAASVPAALGLPATVTRFLAVYRARQEWSLARGLLRYADRVSALAGLLLAVLLVVVGAFAWRGERLWVFVLAAPLVPLFAVLNLRQKTLQGLERPVLAQIPLQILKPGAFLLGAGGLWLAGAQAIRTPVGVMAAWLVSVGFAILAAHGLARRSSSRALRTATPEYDREEWKSVALPLLVAGSIGVVYTATDTLLLGALRPASDVGLYQVGLRTAGLLSALLGASNWVLAPWFAKLHDEADLPRLQRVVTRTTRAVFAVTVMGFAVLATWGKPLLGFFFGGEFRAAYPVLLVLGFATLVNVGMGPVVSLLQMTGGQKPLAVTTGAAALINLAGCAVLIPRIGMMGAAWSFGAAMCVMNVVLAIVVERRLGVGPTVLGSRGR